jgi:uncharacterized Tic20 family protein
MQNQPLSPKIRLRATLCHTCGLAFVPILIIIQFILNLNFEVIQFFLRVDIDPKSWFFGGLIIYGAPTLALILATLLVIAFWQFNANLNPFVDQSGRRATNLMISYCLYFITFSSLIWASCGVPVVSNTIGIF